MTRTIYMEVSCPECGYYGEMDGRNWSPKANHCPKCKLGTLIRGETVQQRGTTLEKATEEAKHPAEPTPVVEPVAELPKELPKELPAPTAKRYFGSGREEVENYVEEGKTLEEITKLMEGKLAATTVKVYYGYAIKAPERDQVKQKAEKPKAAKMGRPRTGEWLKCADCRKDIYVTLDKLEGKPKDYPFRCQACSQQYKAAQATANLPVKQYKDMRIVNIDVFEEFIDRLRKELEQIPKTESTSGALIVIAQISGMLKMFKKDIYLK